MNTSFPLQVKERNWLPWTQILFVSVQAEFNLKPGNIKFTFFKPMYLYTFLLSIHMYGRKI